METSVVDATGQRVVVHGMQDDGTYGTGIVDTDGTERAKLGQLGGGHVGVRVASLLGSDVLYADERGMDAPWLELPTFDPNLTKTVTSGAGWVTCWRGIMVLAQWEAVRIYTGWQIVDGSTTGKLRIVTNAHGFTTTSGTLAAASGGTAQVNWLHRVNVGTAGYITFDVQGEVTAGAGTLYLYTPVMAMMNGDHGATTAGAWS